MCPICLFPIKGADAVYDPRKTQRCRTVVHERCARFLVEVRPAEFLPDRPSEWVQLVFPGLDLDWVSAPGESRAAKQKG